MTRETQAFIALGGNVGDVVAAFAHAVQRLSQSGAHVVQLSRVFRTPPWGKLDQPDFLNMVVDVRTALSGHELLALCLVIETEQGRDRFEHWGPRTLDLDILIFGDEVSQTPELTLPHPRMWERAFVLVPLADCAPDLVVADRSVQEALAELDASAIKPDDALSQRLRDLVSLHP